jgi:hypothetical protein
VWQAWRRSATPMTSCSARPDRHGSLSYSTRSFPGTVWVLPFTVFRPCWGLLALNITVPLLPVLPHRTGALPRIPGPHVWLIWVPIWCCWRPRPGAPSRSGWSMAGGITRSDLAGATPPYEG